MYGWDWPFGSWVGNLYEENETRDAMSEGELTWKVEEAWPKLQNISKDINILKLSDERRGRLYCDVKSWVRPMEH
ncbi:hypothetical protein K445DRAFT_315535 [Daldinia sp. EC12]|nr:hypothetical protein K445DRAFT_315535 [Daldinia sp. EC12]